MSKKDTIHSAYHISLEKEIHRILDNLKEVGIKSPTKLEATALIAYKNQKAKMNVKEVFNFFSQLRGVKL